MRAFVQFHLFSGDAWFTAAAIIITIAALDFFKVLSRVRWAPPVARVSLLLAIGLGLLSGTPMPLAAGVILLAALLGYGATIGRFESPWARLLPFFVILLAAAAAAAEVRFHRDPQVSIRNVQEIVVVGDSLSSGGFGEAKAWPHLLAGWTKLSLRDMSVAGQTSRQAAAGYSDALARLAPASLVIIEIGGNDVLERESVESFSRGLESLVRAARSATPYVLVIELPVLPGGWRYGAAQRSIVDRYGATLVPKHFLAAFLTDPRNTSDGLHPTQHGHDVFARRMAETLEKK